MARRKFKREFKVSAVKLVNEQGYMVPAAAKSSGVDPNCVRGWVGKSSKEPGPAPTGDGAMAAELARLRKENATLLIFWSTLKTELVHHENYATHDQARASIFEYVEVFYNRKRLHSSLGYVSPQAFEAGLNSCTRRAHRSWGSPLDSPSSSCDFVVQSVFRRYTVERRSSAAISRLRCTADALEDINPGPFCHRHRYRCR